MWESIHRKEGGHYNTFRTASPDGMAALRALFPEGKADDLNFVLFSTSGVHGHYGSIEDCERKEVDDVTFVVVHPRLATLRYGNCTPQSPEDFAYLKSLRASSWEVVQGIGRDAFSRSAYP